MAGLDFDFRGQPPPQVYEFQCEKCGEPTSSLRPEETLCSECVGQVELQTGPAVPATPVAPIVASQRTAAVDEDAEWQRVNSYIADVLKDCYVLFAKLARLRGDFAGSELAKLDSVSSRVRDTGQELAGFSKSFTEGEYSMSKKEQYGEEGGEGMDVEIPSDFEPSAEDFDFGQGGGEGEEPALEEFGQGEEEEEKPEEKETEKKGEE
jgi:hypothetical protein